MHVAAHVDHRARAKRQKLLHEALITPLARGVDNHRRPLSRKMVYGRKNVRGIAGEKRTSARGEVVQFGVGGGGTDGVGGEFDAGDNVKVGGEEDGEEAAATVGVDEVGW